MDKLVRKLLGKLNIAIALTLAVVMIGGLGGATYVLASNSSTQSASTASATTITVVGKLVDTAVATITFPEGAPDATISVPYNSVEGAGDPQVLSGTVSEPVVRLKNTSAGTLNVTLETATWNGTYAGFVASEDYELVVTTDTTIAAVASALSANGAAASVATGIGITTGAYKALYLELVLGALAGKTDTSALTILGETP